MFLTIRTAGLLCIALIFSSTIASAQSSFITDVNSPNYAPQISYAPSQAFAEWLAQFRQDAMVQGINKYTLDKAFSGIYEDLDVVRLDRNQPESTITFTRYLSNVVPDFRVKKAHELFEEHYNLLEKIAKQYDVPAQYILALWGIESSFGAHTGGYNIINSLATLAYEGRRAEFFKDELIRALRIIQNQDINPAQMTGSWAGAMGHSQFMPSSYERFAVDYDGDGKKDIWTSLPDVFASIANYLHSSGWKGDEIWGRKVRLPDNFDTNLENIEAFRPLQEWAAYGIRQDNGDALPKSTINAALIFGNRTSKDEGVYLIYPNYNVILLWNKSRFFATAVGTFADKIKAYKTYKDKK